MPPEPRLLERTAALKQQLLELAQSQRFRREVAEQFSTALGPQGARDEGEFAFTMDEILLQHRFSEGKTLVEHFVEQHRDLPEAERQLLLGWRNARQGMFRVDQNDGGSLLLFNLIDDLSYRVYSNVGRAFYDRVETGMFLLARLTPLGDEWLFSGGTIPLPPAAQNAAYEIALSLAQRVPAVVFQNPALLELGWKLQRQERQDFIEHFGSDTVVVPGKQLARRMDEYMRWRMSGKRDASGKTVVERATERDGTPPQIPRIEIPEDIRRSDSVGIIYDESDGLHFLPEFGLVEETFADPARLEDPAHEDAILNYLESPGIIPLPLRRLGDRDPDKATRVFRTLLDDPGFSWPQDSERLLRDYKPVYYADPPLPSVTPLPDDLAGFSRTPRHAKHPGRNNPCTCGSGKKYKHCHGRQSR